jgi:predicted heme/steroid binding protein
VAAIVANDMTPEQLAQFDGKEGRPGYFGYKGIVYSVTENRFWRKGTHMMKHHAGTDLTETLKLAPHGEEKVRALPQVGTLISSGERPARPFHEQLFYFFAYMNLTLVFIIVLIISLWRWW